MRNPSLIQPLLRVSRRSRRRPSAPAFRPCLMGVWERLQVRPYRPVEQASSKQPRVNSASAAAARSKSRHEARQSLCTSRWPGGALVRCGGIQLAVVTVLPRSLCLLPHVSSRYHEPEGQPKTRKPARNPATAPSAWRTRSCVQASLLRGFDLRNVQGTLPLSTEDERPYVVEASSNATTSN